jgi:hypothetical protein
MAINSCLHLPISNAFPSRKQWLCFCFKSHISNQVPALAFPAAEAARGVLAHFSLFVKELRAQLAQFFAAAMFQLANDWVEWRFVFHGAHLLNQAT